MSLTLRIRQQDEHWARIEGATGRVVKAIQSLKANYRSYDREEYVWLVYWEELGKIVSVAKTQYEYVDYGTLPAQWQMVAAGASPNVRRRSPVSSPVKSHWDFLYVLREAPREVVKAAYKALVTLHHPDVGGDVERFREIDSAYKAIKAMWEK